MLDLRPDERPDERYDIRIAHDGSWHHEGAPIKRMELVRLFATVLRRDDAGDYWLITPAERGRIVVEDAPFIAVEMTCEGEGEALTVSFRTNLDEWVTAGPDHPIRIAKPHRNVGGGDNVAVPVPYVAIRDGLEARVSRAVYYQLVEHCVPAGDGAQGGGGEGGMVGIWSAGQFFILGDASGDDQAR